MRLALKIGFMVNAALLGVAAIALAAMYLSLEHSTYFRGAGIVVVFILLILLPAAGAALLNVIVTGGALLAPNAPDAGLVAVILVNAAGILGWLVFADNALLRAMSVSAPTICGLSIVIALVGLKAGKPCVPAAHEARS